MPIVSGFVIPKMKPTSHVGNIRLLRPVVVSIERKEDNQAENEHIKDAEELKEILHMVSEVGVIGFLVLLSDPFSFILKHTIGLTDIPLHL